MYLLFSFTNRSDSVLAFWCQNLVKCFVFLFCFGQFHSIRSAPGTDSPRFPLGILVGHTRRTRAWLLKTITARNGWPRYICDGNITRGHDWPLGFRGAWHAWRCRVQKYCSYLLPSSVACHLGRLGHIRACNAPRASNHSDPKPPFASIVGRFWPIRLARLTSPPALPINGCLL